MKVKPLVWLSGEVRTPPFSRDARVEAGCLLRRLQEGESIGMPHSKPIHEVGRGCHELRLPDRTESWRIVYAVRRDAIVILEVFSKKTTRMPVAILEACRGRLARYDSLLGDDA